MTVVCIALILAFVAREYMAYKEREKMQKRLTNPQQVIVEDRPKRPKVEPVSMNDDAAFKRRREARGQ